MRTWSNVSEAAEYAGVSRTRSTPRASATSFEVRASAEDARFEFGWHGSMPGWNDTRRTFKIAPYR